MRALITGIPGFAGSYLAEELISHGYKVAGTSLPGEGLHNLNDIASKIEILPFDFLKGQDFSRILQACKPNYIFHLAAQASVARSFKNPEETYQINFWGTLRLLESARKLSGLEGILLVSSSEIYGIVKPKDLPVSTRQSLQPVSPYGVSKAISEMIGYQFYKNFRLPVVRVRAFNHSGPRQACGFVIPDFCSQIAQLERSNRKRIMKVGNLSAKRDISDVRDVVAGYRLALEKGEPGEVYQICSGKAYAISALLKKLLSMSANEIESQSEPKLTLPTEVPILMGDPSVAEKRLGYKRKFTIDDTLRDCLEYYRRLQGGQRGRASR